MAFANELTWSKSRDSLFKECRRAYYLQYYGSWGGWEKSAPPDVRTLYIMKNLQNRATWIGSAVHDVAEVAIKAVQRGRPQDKDRVLKRLESKLRRDLEESQEGRYVENPKRFLGLTAHYYDKDSDQGHFEEAIELGLSCAQIFFDSKVYGRVRQLGPEGILTVEELQSFPVDGVKVWVKLDLSMKGKDGKVVIVDWKTGKHHVKEDMDLQLGVYGLYGTRAWDLGHEQILAFDVNLRDGSLQTHPIDESTLTTVEAYIRGSIDEMRSVLDDVETNTASIENFALTEDLWKCRRCRFRGVCNRESV